MADLKFLVAKRAEVDRLEALARETLRANPYSESAAKEEEDEWRELAHSIRQMRLLLEAIERADAGQPDYKRYRDGFDFRLTEAMANIATLCSYGRLQGLHQRGLARKSRPKARSPFTEFITDRLKRNPYASAQEVEVALVDDAKCGQSGDFELSTDGSTVLTTGSRVRRQKISGIPAAFAKAKKKYRRYPVSGKARCERRLVTLQDEVVNVRNFPGDY